MSRNKSRNNRNNRDGGYKRPRHMEFDHKLKTTNWKNLIDSARDTPIPARKKRKIQATRVERPAENPSFRQVDVSVRSRGRGLQKGQGDEDRFRPDKEQDLPPVDVWREKMVRILTTTRKRSNLKLYNRHMNDAAKYRNVELAEALWEQLLETGLKPDIYSYSALLNVYARIGHSQKLNDTFEELKNTPGIKPNTVVFTTVLKGYVNEMMMDQALVVLNEMHEHGVIPNIRTYGTLLRGFLRDCEFEEAEKLFKYAYEQHIVNDTLVNIMLKLSARTFRWDKVLFYLKVLKKGDFVRFKSTYLDMAICSGILGKVKESAALLNFLKSPSVEVDTELAFGNMDFYDMLKAWIIKRKGKAYNILGPKNSKLVFYSDTEMPKLEWNSEMLFNNDNPVKVEIGCGNGNWICEKAKSDKKTNWVAMELRKDRIFYTWLNMVIHKARNIRALCGDAKEPVFLNASLFNIVYDMLTEDGLVTVVTDDKTFAECLASELKQSGFETALNKDMIDRIPSAYGTSWFDSMWKSRGRDDRYFMQFKKADVDAMEQE